MDIICTVDRRFVTNESSVETYEVPLDVKVEVALGLLLCAMGTIAIYTTNLGSIDLMNYF